MKKCTAEKEGGGRGGKLTRMGVEGSRKTEKIAAGKFLPCLCRQTDTLKSREACALRGKKVLRRKKIRAREPTGVPPKTTFNSKHPGRTQGQTDKKRGTA